MPVSAAVFGRFGLGGVRGSSAPNQGSGSRVDGRVRRGDAAGAARLFQRYAAPLLRFTGRGLLANVPEAEEKQTSFSSSWCGPESKSRSPRGSSPSRTTPAGRLALSGCGGGRAVSLEVVAESQPASSGRTPADRARREAEQQHLVRTPSSASHEDQREALVLARYHEMPLRRGRPHISDSRSNRGSSGRWTLKATFQRSSSWNAARL